MSKTTEKRSPRSSSKSAPPLIVDTDIAFLDSIRTEAKDAFLLPELAHNGKIAQLLLANPDKKFLALFVNTALPDDYALSVVRFAHQRRSSLPIYLLVDPEGVTFSEEQIKRLGITGVIQKPITYTKLLELMRPLHRHFERHGERKESDELDLVPIDAEGFRPGSQSPFDLYVKLPTQRYVKILKAGDDFSHERHASYLKKGVKEFYLPRSDQESYINYCDRLASGMNRSKKISIDIRVTQTLAHGEAVMQFLQKNAVNPTYIKYATSFVSNVRELVTQTRLNHNPYLDTFLADIAAYDHGVGVTLMAAILAKSLNMTSSTPHRLVGLASLFHDIGLTQLPEELRHHDYSKMTKNQRSMHAKHVHLGADILKSFSEIEPSAIQAVAQHHERRDRSGYPDQLGGNSINRVAQIIGICDDFHTLIVQAKDDPKLNPIEKIQETMSKQFSHAIVDAFRSAFINREPIKNS